MMGRPTEAQTSAEAALEIAQSKGDKLSEMYAKGLMVQVCLQEKNNAGANKHLKEVQGIAEELGDPQAKEMADQLRELVHGSGGQQAAAAAPEAAAVTAG